jgi:hypothetical protein
MTLVVAGVVAGVMAFGRHLVIAPVVLLEAWAIWLVWASMAAAIAAPFTLVSGPSYLRALALAAAFRAITARFKVPAFVTGDITEIAMHWTVLALHVLFYLVVTAIGVYA